MKVKIMDYETAKAEVLARNNNPCFANDGTVLGISYRWEGWGQARDVDDKDTDYANNVFVFRDVKDGYSLPNYLIDATPEDVLRYGEVINDESFALYSGQNVRIRIISYNDYIYYHKMADGEVVDFKPIGLVLK